MSEKKRQVKLAVMGKGVSGKDSLIERVLQNRQDPYQMATLQPQLSFSTKKTVPEPEVQWLVQSFSGQERFQGLAWNFLAKTHAVLLCVSVNFPKEATDVTWLPEWIQKIREYTNAPIFLVWTMADRASFEAYPELPPGTEELIDLGKVSAKTGEGCDTLLKSILVALPEPPPEPASPKLNIFQWFLSLFKF